MSADVQLASSKSGRPTNRGCAGEVILPPVNGVLLGTAITSEESISPLTPTSAGHVRHMGPWARIHASRRTVATYLWAPGTTPSLSGWLGIARQHPRLNAPRPHYVPWVGARCSDTPRGPTGWRGMLRLR